MDLKFDDKLSSIAHCPPGSVQQLYKIGYRFVFSPLSDSRNFLPVAIKSPERMIQGVKADKTCSGYALSMFGTLDQLMKIVRKAESSSPNYVKRKLGDHYAELKIEPTDGFCTQEDTKGHFDFFQEKSFDPLNAVIKTEAL